MKAKRFENMLFAKIIKISHDPKDHFDKYKIVAGMPWDGADIKGIRVDKKAKLIVIQLKP